MKAEVLTLLVVCSLTRIANSRRPFAFHFKSILCAANPKSISVFNCSVDELDSVPTISMDVLLARDLANLTYDLAVMLPRNRQDLVLFNMTQLDGCSFLENTSPFPLVQIIRNEFAKSSTFPKKCPVSRGTTISIRGLRIDPESFPNYVPETKFSVRVGMYEAGSHLLNITVNGTCESTKRFFKGRGWGTHTSLFIPPKSSSQ